VALAYSRFLIVSLAEVGLCRVCHQAAGLSDFHGGRACARQAIIIEDLIGEIDNDSAD
jgi:hypothetical protein